MANETKQKKISLVTYKNIVETMAKAYKASIQVLEENKKFKIPTPFSLQGRIYNLMPDGRIVLQKKKPPRG